MIKGKPRGISAKYAIAVLLCWCLNSWSQTSYLPYVHIGLEEGLPSQLCNMAIEDTLGNIWIANFNVLIKYNGYSAKTFDSSNSQLGGFPIFDMTLDQNGIIWILATTNEKYYSKPLNKYFSNYKIFLISPNDDKIQTFDEFFGKENIKKDDVLELYFRYNEIVLLTNDHKVLSYTDNFSKLGEIDTSKKFLNIGKNGYYFQEQAKLNFINYDGTLHEDILPNKTPIVNKHQSNKNGNLCIFNDHNAPFFPIHILDDQNLHLLNFDYFPEATIANNYHYRNTISIDSTNNIFKAGEKIFLKGDSIDILKKLGIEKNYISSISTTASGQMLLSTPKGLYITHIKEYPFKQLATHKDLINSTTQLLSHKDLFIYNDKIEKYESPSGKYRFPTLTSDFNGATHYLDSTNDILLTCGIGPIIRIIDFKNKSERFIKTKDNIGILNFYFHKQTETLYLYCKNNIYTSKAPYKVLKPVESLNKFVNNKNSCNHINGNGDEIIIATNQGLYRYEQNLDKVEYLNISKSKNIKAQFIHFDKEDESTYWISTYGEGLYSWNDSIRKLDYYGKEEGLSDLYTHSIHEDNKSRLWIATNNNLNCLDKKSGNIYVFTTKEGISHSEFNRNGYFFDDQSGTVYYGGLNGYTYFKPDEMELKNEYEVKPRLIDAVLTKKNFDTENIFMKIKKNYAVYLHEDDSFVDLSLSTNEIFNLDNTKYSYRITSINNKWKHIESNQLRISNLPYGQHILEIKSNLNNPFKTSKSAFAKVHVVRPFYKQNWFRLLCVLLGIGLIYKFNQWQNRNTLKRKRELEIAVKNRTNELHQANESKKKLFAILSHDLRGPISGLSNITEQIQFLVKNDRIDELITLAEFTENKVQSLNDNIDNILKWATLEKGTNEPNFISLTILDQINKVLILYGVLIKEKNIEIKLDIENTKSVISDKFILQTILRNAIQNSIKFAPINSMVEFSFLKNTLLIANMYDNNLKAEGTGIGLLIVDELSKFNNTKTSLKLHKNGKSYFSIEFKTV